MLALLLRLGVGLIGAAAMSLGDSSEPAEDDAALYISPQTPDIANLILSGEDT